MKSFGTRLIAVVLALAFVATVAPQRLQASSNRAPKHSENEVLISVAPGANPADVAARHGTSLLAPNARDGKCYRLVVPAGKSASTFAEELERDPLVPQAEPNYWVHTVETQRFSLGFSGEYRTPDDSEEAWSLYTGQWAAGKIRLPEAQALATGDNVVVAVLDTGIQPDHPAVADKLSQGGYDFVDMDADPFDAATGIDTDDDGYADEGAGHGTFIAGIIALVAPDAKIMPVRVLNSDGVGTVFAVAEGIKYAVDNGADVINLSLGSTTNSLFLKQAVAYAHSHGVTVVASVGNNPPSSRNEQVMYPARYGSVIAVAAVDQGDVKASFSNWGRRTDVSAPGISVFSAYLDGRWAWWSGTSVAAAFVTGEAALVKGQHTTWTDADIAARIGSTADNIDRLNSPRYRNKLGEGRINVLAAVQ